MSDCPKCGGSMEPGFIVDEGYGRYDRARWQSGAADKAWWGGLRIRKKELIGVSTDRCRRCGYLESYARA